MSYNNIIGNLPKSFQFSQIQYLNLKSNNISGPLPSKWGMMDGLDLSQNQINGSFPNETCDITKLEYLDLSTNAISGEINICWNNSSYLSYIDLSNNQITGELPAAIGSLQELLTLQLDNNQLYGEIPSTLQYCKSLIFLSLARNNFSGEIPSWIGKQLHDLVVLQLRSNKFIGIIPPEIGELSNLHILDLAHNSLIGPIPSSMSNFSSMKNSSQCFQFVWGDVLYVDINSIQYAYTSEPLFCVKSIDISGNNIDGQIPEEIWLLEALINLNLSKNHLIGEIPETIGGMRSLESLDLSFNNLSGMLPQALSSLSLLHNLNLSYNNFSGKIPTGRQLDTLNDSSIYVGNSYICGPPTNNNCSEDQAFNGVNYDHGVNGREMIWFCSILVSSFILGFWIFWGVLIFQNTWRLAHFRMIDRLFGKMYMHIVFAMRRFGWS
jgi:Leucine-rich repeat (LRR) protein